MGDVEWEKLRILGKGSYGIVFKVKMTSPKEIKGRVLAVKSSKGECREYLEKEGSILRSFLGCKEIAQCFGSQMSIEDGELVSNLIMELAPYGSFGDFINKRVLSEGEVKTYARLLLRGLSLIHQRGIVHCDLKPDNILLFPSTENGVRYHLKIADFGVSRTPEERFDPDIWKLRFRGTPLYMSPESVMGQIDPSLDIWSFGCIVIEMITGFRAWNNIPSAEDMMFKLAILKQAPPMPCFISLDCQDFLSKCFDMDPNKRWTATMLLDHPFLAATNNIGATSLSTSRFSFFSYDCFLPCNGQLPLWRLGYRTCDLLKK